MLFLKLIQTKKKPPLKKQRGQQDWLVRWSYRWGGVAAHPFCGVPDQVLVLAGLPCLARLE